jgi:UDP-N-acetylmuramoyl-L-alanyl-D-glutamate--2,6-diaminopimelate ligase
VAARAFPPPRAPFPWADPFTTVGTTGTNGKTSTTILIAHAIHAAGHHVISETTVGYLLDARPSEGERSLEGFYAAARKASDGGTRHASLEVTSQSLGRGFAQRWRFDVGVFTNLTRDHMDTHGSFEHYLASKAQLFLWLAHGGTAVLNAADPSSALIEKVTPDDVKRLSYAVASRGPVAGAVDLLARRVEVAVDGTTIALEPSSLADRLGRTVRTRLVGEVFAENALAAACAALAIEIPPASIQEGFDRCRTVPGRFEILHVDPIVAVDYAHTPDALARVCDTARRLAGEHRVIVVFGAGGGRDQGKRPQMGEVVAERADVAFVTSDNPRGERPEDIAAAIVSGCRGKATVRLEPDRRAAIEQAILTAHENDVVVIAGKGHETGQIVGDETRPFSDVEVVAALVGGPAIAR